MNERENKSLFLTNITLTCKKVLDTNIMIDPTIKRNKSSLALGPRPKEGPNFLNKVGPSYLLNFIFYCLPEK